jgi:hypothetical protein
MEKYEIEALEEALEEAEHRVDEMADMIEAASGVLRHLEFDLEDAHHKARMATEAISRANNCRGIKW